MNDLQHNRGEPAGLLVRRRVGVERRRPGVEPAARRSPGISSQSLT